MEVSSEHSVVWVNHCIGDPTNSVLNRVILCPLVNPLNRDLSLPRLDSERQVIPLQ